MQFTDITAKNAEGTCEAANKGAVVQVQAFGARGLRPRPADHRAPRDQLKVEYYGGRGAPM